MHDVASITVEEFNRNREALMRQLAKKFSRERKWAKGSLEVLKDGALVGCITEAASLYHVSDMTIRNWCERKMHGWRYA
jgi:hypothetical protein